MADVDLTPTPGQTVGPFYSYALCYPGDSQLVPPGTPGALRLHGTVRDGHGAPVPDALLEIRQADPTGAVPVVAGSYRRDGHTFTGWGRCGTDAAGHYSFTTLEPGPHRAGGPRYVAVTVFARGLLNRLFTRAYLPEDLPEDLREDRADPAVVGDPLLAGLPAERRRTLVAERDPDGGLRFDVHLQGERETVFLRYPRHEA